MSLPVLTAVFAHSESTLAGRLVLLALADSAHDDGVTWIDQDTIARKARVNASTVRRCLRDLEAEGEVETRKVQRGRRRIAVYRVLVPGVVDVKYDDLPFEVKEPFATAQIERSSEGDDRSNGDATTAHPERGPRGRVKAGDPSDNRKGAKAPPREDCPPALHLIDGRNVALDALTEECGVEQGSPRYPQAVVALNGRKTPKTEQLRDPGVRHLFWRELLRWATEHPDDAHRLDELDEDPERFERALERGIRRKAALYRERMPGAALTPKALRDWWLDVERLRDRDDGGLTPAEMAAFPA